ncbi:TIGR03747 family integrating conjugative element membrane protein [Klebsiella pneumoniae]
MNLRLCQIVADNAPLQGWIALVFLMRVTIRVLSVPLFILVAIEEIADGMVRRDLRRYGAVYESSFLYHHAKRVVKPVAYIPCVLYLSALFAVYPNLLLLPAALLMGLAISVTMGSFKKYL